MDRFFKMAGDLDVDNLYEDVVSNKSRLIVSPNMNIQNKEYSETPKVLDSVDNLDIETYLSNIVSGVKYDYESELGTVCSEGNVIISLNELQKMVDSGEYNIISANYFNNEMIEIKYQQIEKNISRKM